MHTTVGIDLAGINLALTVAGVQEFNDGDRVEVHLDTETLLFFDPISGRRVGKLVGPAARRLPRPRRATAAGTYGLHGMGRRRGSDPRWRRPHALRPSP